MLNLTQPRYVMPIHGDHKRLHLHGKLAEAVGIDPDAIFKGRNGLPLEIDERGARFGEQEHSGVGFVDGVEVGDIEDVALRDGDAGDHDDAEDAEDEQQLEREDESRAAGPSSSDGDATRSRRTRRTSAATALPRSSTPTRSSSTTRPVQHGGSPS